MTQTIFSLGFVSWIVFCMGISPCGLVPPPPQWTSFPPLFTAVLFKSEGAESPGSRRIGVIGALVLFHPSETVGARGDGALQRADAARPLDRTRVMRSRGQRGVYWVSLNQYTPLNNVNTD